MSEREHEAEELIDPPENQGGGGAISLEAPTEEAAAIDPPDNQGGGN